MRARSSTSRSGQPVVRRPPDLATFARLLQSVADQILGPGFAAVWQMMANSFHLEALEAGLPGATVQVWPNSGHFPHLTDPRRFAAQLAASAQWQQPWT